MKTKIVLSLSAVIELLPLGVCVAQSSNGSNERPFLFEQAPAARSMSPYLAPWDKRSALVGEFRARPTYVRGRGTATVVAGVTAINPRHISFPSGVGSNLVEAACPAHGNTVIIVGSRFANFGEISGKGRTSSEAAILRVNCGGRPANIISWGNSYRNFGDINSQ